MKPRKIKNLELSNELDIEQLVATGGDSMNIYAMNFETEVPTCPECHQHMRNHGKFERQYLDVISEKGELPRIVILHYLFYKYRCENEECGKTIYQKPIEFARESANVTYRLENLIMKHAVTMSYSQVEQKIRGAVTKQAIGQITKRWTNCKDAERGMIYFSPQVLGMISFFWDNQEYILAVDASDGNLIIIDVIMGVETEKIQLFLSHLNKENIVYVVTDCNPIVVESAKDMIPGAEVLVDTDALFKEVLDSFRKIIRAEAMHVANVDKERLLKAPNELSEWEVTRVRDITEIKPRVSTAYDYVNTLRSILSRDWDITDIKDWQYKMPIDCEEEFSIASAYVDEYWKELLNFYKRRTVVTGELYGKLQKLDAKMKKFKNCSVEIFRARVLYLCKIGQKIKETDGYWHGADYETVMDMMNQLVNELEEKRNEYY